MGNEGALLQKIRKQINKLSKGYVLVHKQAVKLVEDYIDKKTKKHGKFLYATSKSDKPPGGKDLNKLVTGIKKTPPGTVKAYTTNPILTTKIFGASLMKAGRLKSVKYCEKEGCVCIFLISQNLENKYKKFQSLEEVPTEENLERNNLVKEFRKEVNTHGVDFSNVLLSIEKKQIPKSAQDNLKVAKKVEKLESTKITQKTKGDSEISSKKPKLSIESLSKKLESVNVDKLDDSKKHQYVKSFRNFFMKAASKLDKESPTLKKLETILNALDIDFSKIDEPKIRAAIKKINSA